MRTEFNVGTGDFRQIDTTPYLVDGALVFVDAGQPVPLGASVPPPIDPNIVPQVVTRRQALLALLAAGKLDAVEQQMSTAPRAVRIAWESAGTFERANPLIDELAPTLGLSPANIDELFIAASSL
ncbi:hypothetical protein [Aquabacterium parvum]|jgi:hypothetical protein|uniref:hypothetical protein n=1 Tax=Aquabacterium parvum TaxID=70584 RepID=UPI000718BFDC|nr:hypothetical protein [Aquabacterium parvum]MBU0916330.1 hypothetical protein [Gammaproteobacteria bacterium]